MTFQKFWPHQRLQSSVGDGLQIRGERLGVDVLCKTKQLCYRRHTGQVGDALTFKSVHGVALNLGVRSEAKTCGFQVVTPESAVWCWGPTVSFSLCRHTEGPQQTETGRSAWKHNRSKHEDSCKCHPSTIINCIKVWERRLMFDKHSVSHIWLFPISLHL